MTPAVIGIVRVGTWTIACALAVLGLVSVGTAVVMPALIAPTVGGTVAWALARHRGLSGLRLRKSVVFGAVAGEVFVLATVALVVLLGPSAILVAGLLGAVLLWLHRRPAPRPTQEQTTVDEAPLRGLSNVQLARAWQRSYVELAAAHDAFTLSRLCALRRQQLDEIERRDPTGFHRWINSGYWVRGDSAPFLGT